MKVVLGLLMGLMSVSAFADDSLFFQGYNRLVSGDASKCSQRLGVHVVAHNGGGREALVSSNMNDSGPALEISGVAGGSEQDGVTQFTSINVSGGRAELTFQFVMVRPRYNYDVRRVSVVADATSAVYEVTSFVDGEGSFRCTFAAE